MKPIHDGISGLEVRTSPAIAVQTWIVFWKTADTSHALKEEASASETGGKRQRQKQKLQLLEFQELLHALELQSLVQKTKTVQNDSDKHLWKCLGLGLDHW